MASRGVGRFPPLRLAHRLFGLLLCGSACLISGSARAIDGGARARGSDQLARATVAIATLSETPGQIGVSRCSGVLIRPDVVLTAAHCVRNNPVGAAVLLYNGANAVPEPHWVATVARYAVPPGEASTSAYVRNIATLSLDVALLRLVAPVRGRKPIPLERARGGIPSRLILAGAGLSRDGVGTLKTAILKPLAVTDTGLTFAVSLNGRVCVGDSGGPVVAPGKSGLQLWGVASAVVDPQGPCGNIVVIAPARAAARY
jgi:hypothetical protein